ncbi:Bro-N domain-containing protein [Acinetobacter sp. YH12123]|uniref:BRO-N domain-containing protein n=1 Tax=Acinetobacter sp. YH12123 TaxID=2601108 RepID=UPI0015D1790F|nr:Bro-N domain-containing protein [Acinetobacter sp. YH12123]
MTSLALSFNDVNFTPVQQDNQAWITSRELGQALGYSREDAVNKIFERNSDEFTGSMTRNVKLTLQGQAREVRVFSLRGCHLIAMLSRTAIAKQFRKWVLDVLDREVVTKQLESRQSISPEQQALLHEIVARRSQGERKIFAEMWARHNRHFKIPRYAELLAIHFSEAVHYLETMELKAKVSTKQDNLIQIDKNYHNNVQGLAWHMLWIREWWKKFGEPIRAISPNMAAAIHDHFTDGAMFAYHFIDKEDLKKQRERTEYFQWHLSCTERMALDYKRK